MQKLRITVGLLFTALLLWQAMGVFPTFEFTLNRVRREMKAAIKNGVPESEWVEFAIDSIQSHITWTKPEKEFRYRDKMYDVLHYRGDSSEIVVCIMDVKESGLFEHLEELVAQSGYGNDDHPGPIRQVIKAFSPVYILSEDMLIPPALSWHVIHRSEYHLPGSAIHPREVEHPPC
ncbi:hypothetical protein [Phaeocystidibacter marisrubri]|uniref:Uncharacterized protein n=1 Tax=Phaeocystidibacter marisrubri TaxID=1577780 RepID=A0A6L3ZE41_9FLAO|nr:hypothetical protein [Phaeocystidibacter marisrubri]KAB2815858.1 hypothetical protein F8C82_09170 [Phaeocystidibacter marisrubri]GGH66080.1 hypothetical protein GCM10011318_03690 [Phaeocystidibacter marisrubri]